MSETPSGVPTQDTVSGIPSNEGLVSSEPRLDLVKLFADTTKLATQLINKYQLSPDPDEGDYGLVVYMSVPGELEEHFVQSCILLQSCGLEGIQVIHHTVHSGEDLTQEEIMRFPFIVTIVWNPEEMEKSRHKLTLF